MGGTRAEGSLKLKLLQVAYSNCVSKVTKNPLLQGCSFMLYSCQDFDLIFSTEELKLSHFFSK